MGLAKTILKVVAKGYGFIQEERGHTPTTLLNYISNNPDFLPPLIEPAQSIDSESVVKWHLWGNPSLEYASEPTPFELRCWDFHGGQHGGFVATIPEMEDFCTFSVVPDWQCDIQDIEGLTNSKTDLRKYSSMDSFAQYGTHKLIDDLTEEQLFKVLAHHEIRIIHTPGTSDCFIKRAWDKRLFLSNGGGSHHLAAARYIAGRLKIKVALQGRLNTYLLNLQAIKALQRKFCIYTISNKPKHLLGFRNAMFRFRASYGWSDLPRPYNFQAIAIFLPKDEPRSLSAALYLSDAKAFNLGLYLYDLANNQR